MGKVGIPEEDHKEVGTRVGHGPHILSVEAGILQAAEDTCSSEAEEHAKPRHHRPDADDAREKDEPQLQRLRQALEHVLQLGRLLEWIRRPPWIRRIQHRLRADQFCPLLPLRFPLACPTNLDYLPCFL